METWVFPMLNKVNLLQSRRNPDSSPAFRRSQLSLLEWTKCNRKHFNLLLIPWNLLFPQCRQTKCHNPPHPFSLLPAVRCHHPRQCLQWHQLTLFPLPRSNQDFHRWIGSIIHILINAITLHDAWLKISQLKQIFNV